VKANTVQKKMNEAQRNNFSVCGFRDEGSLSMTTAGVKAEI